MAERKLIVRIIGDDESIRKSFLRSSRAGKQFEGSITGSLGKIRIGIGTLAKSFVVIEVLQKAMEGLSESVHLGTEEFADHARVQAQTQAALKSTGAVANVSAKQIEGLGLTLSNLSGIDDELIQKGENLLLSFTNIRNFQGKNNDIFTQATKIMVDFAARTGRDAASAAVILGRALEDPATRVTSLSRAGVVFTRQQIKQLQAIEKTKGVLAAQKVLLQELEKRFGGAGKAAGETLPGQLNILRERFKDLAGSGIGLVAPSLSRAATALTNFVRRLSEATSGRQKLRIAFSGIETIGRDLFNGIRRQVESIDFRSIGRTVGRRLAAIDWRSQITAAGRAIGTAIASNLQRLNEVIRNVNWNKVGQEIAKGVGLAIAAAAVFLHSLNLGKITKAIADVLGAVLIAAARVLEGIGQEIGKAILKGISAGLTAAERPIIKKADEIALKIIEPFTHLPFGIGAPAQKAKEVLQKQLDDMAKVAATGAQKVTTALAPISKPIGSRNSSAAFAPTPALPPPPPPVVPTAAAKGLTAAQRNTFFDNTIARILQRGGLGTIQQQIAALQQANRLLELRLKATKDATRRLSLEDEILQNAAQIKSLNAGAAADALQKRQDAMSEFISGLQLRLTKAQATSGFNDDIAALKAIQAGIKSEIKEFGNTADLAGQLFDAQQQLKQARLAKITAKQFRQLGFSATGDAITPTKANLKKQIASLTDRISGTSIDTAKLRSQLAVFRKVLSDALVPPEIRTQIRDMLADIRNQLKEHSAFLPRFARTNQAALLKGLGLDPAQIKELRGRLSQVGVGGTVPASRPAGAAVGPGGTIVVHTVLQMDKDVVGRAVTRHQQKRRQRNPDQRRGVRGGG